eukprot:5214770-Pyramimonas_sp.AAC.1
MAESSRVGQSTTEYRRSDHSIIAEWGRRATSMVDGSRANKSCRLESNNTEYIRVDWSRVDSG